MSDFGQLTELEQEARQDEISELLEQIQLQEQAIEEN